MHQMYCASSKESTYVVYGTIIGTYRFGFHSLAMASILRVNNDN